MELEELALTPPWKHQVEAYNYAMRRNSSLLALSMGLGKTFVALNLIREWGVERGIVVCPRSVMPVWVSQAKEHSPEIMVILLSEGSTADKAARAKFFFDRHDGSVPMLLVCNYESAWRGDLGSFIKDRPDIDAVILDEIHRIKAAGSKVSWFFRSIGAYIPKKLGLSGTPLPNSPLDIYGQARFLNPRVFGSSMAKFKSRYSISGGFKGYETVGWRNQEEFRSKYESLVFTRSLSDTELSLPPVSHNRIIVDLPPKCRKIYDELEKDFIAGVHGGIIVAGNALVRMLRLSQIANGSSTVEDNDEKKTVVFMHDKKQEALSDFLTDLDPVEKVVVFCRFRFDLQQIWSACDKAKRVCFELSGSVNQLERWKSHDGGGVLAVQIQAGSEGVDFTLARYCVYYSLDFSLGRYEQSLARVHRPGQARRVIYTHIIARNTIDGKLYAALSQKRKVIDSILSWASGEEELEELDF